MSMMVVRPCPYDEEVGEVKECNPSKAKGLIVALIKVDKCLTYPWPFPASPLPDGPPFFPFASPASRSPTTTRRAS